MATKRKKTKGRAAKTRNPPGLNARWLRALAKAKQDAAEILGRPSKLG
jgi:hypothetical protein